MLLLNGIPQILTEGPILRPRSHRARLSSWSAFESSRSNRSVAYGFDSLPQSQQLLDGSSPATTTFPFFHCLAHQIGQHGTFILSRERLIERILDFARNAEIHRGHRHPSLVKYSTMLCLHSCLVKDSGRAGTLWRAVLAMTGARVLANAGERISPRDAPPANSFRRPHRLSAEPINRVLCRWLPFRSSRAGWPVPDPLQAPQKSIHHGPEESFS